MRMSDQHLLNGLSVLITRPLDQGQSLAAAIQESGGRSVLFPLIRISPIDNLDVTAEIRSRVSKLDQYDLAIFISTNAVKYGLQWLAKLQTHFSENTQVFAIGPTTAQALNSAGVDVHFSVAGMQSEDLLDLPELQQISGKRIALFRGIGGRELLADTLRQRGAVVDYIETYVRQVEKHKPEDLEKVIKNEGINVISVTSGQILESLCQLVDIGKEWVHQVPLLVPSERIREKALAAGFNLVVNTRGADDESILSGLSSISNLETSD